MKTWSAYANANIALIKYWGKSDTGHNIPAVPSLSMTLEDWGCEVTLTKTACAHEVKRDQNFVSPSAYARSAAFLEHVRSLYHYDGFFCIESKSSIPYASGLASSAAFFAACATALNQALSLNFDHQQRSILARMGSGSAARSIFGEFAALIGGTELCDNDAFAYPVASNARLKLVLVVLVVDDQPKAISSRDAMNVSKLTSPFYQAWLDNSNTDFTKAVAALADGNFTLLGEAMEHSTLKMFATMWTTAPAIMYWQPQSLALINAIYRIRKEHGPIAFFTMDAGPNVKILCEEENIALVLREIAALGLTKSIFCKTPGQGAHLVR